MSLQLQPITQREAEAFIRQHHRHHLPPRGWKFGIAVNDGEKVVGVITVGRPVARGLDDGWEADEGRYEPSTRSSIRETITERAEANGVSAAAMLALAGCETGGTYNPDAVGDHGTSLGLFQLNTLATGLYWHFLAVGYDDWRDATQQADYVSRVAAGAFPGIRLSRWSCWRIIGGGW